MPEDHAQDRAAYLEHRKQLIELGIGQINLFDKSIVFASTGALGLSVAFLDKIAGHGVAVSPALLLTSWISLILSLLMNVLSYKTSWRDTELEITKLDDAYERGCSPAFTRNLFRRITIFLNYGSLLALTIGIMLLLLFAFQNLEHSP